MCLKKLHVCEQNLHNSSYIYFGDFNFDESLGINKLGKNDISVKIPAPPPKKKI